ncbi:MAG: aminotransferase class III-fold pyridoxal phosphate-dependent enzyme [Candidatus Thorarchaeota archaeon]|nr:aminotransferase class III-fold pyridoxal phosphate-dependent enzyme [Candidatus Thorarchaeota archaeon]NIW15354.1 aminotransferase class III-fold pyridoxal phosphate-dependent enzyme [Candidatus Thorarchaeota archaeon]NIW52080.1 aminotransferase class III-fold pyridoxal phosphate-dependent enzyme [Candidatus Korarchaeota archaeon]
MSEKPFMRKYKQKTATSEKLYRKAITLLPDGIGGSAPPYKPYPLFIDWAKGSRIRDVDDNEYIDFNLCWGVLFVGHQHPLLLEGLQEQIQRGTMYGFPHEEIYETAEALIERFPMDKVRFVNSGNESTLYAVRLARRYTGKDKIIKIEGAYHGVSDPLHVSKRPPIGKAGPSLSPSSVPHGEGIPNETVEDTLVAPFNDIEAMEELLDYYVGEIAAVIVEPVMMNSGVIPPEDGYLEALRELTEEENVLLIFDEVKTGVKIAPGGAAEYYGIRPDLISLAKAIGGGLPIGACGGREEIMREVGEEGLFGTFSANPLAIRASKITLTEILTNNAYSKVQKLGDILLSGYQDIIEDQEWDAVVQGVNAVGGILFTDQAVTDYREWYKVDREKTHRYWLKMVNQGIIPMAYGADEEWIISVQHTEKDIYEHLEAFKEVAPEL